MKRWIALIVIMLLAVMAWFAGRYQAMNLHQP